MLEVLLVLFYSLSVPWRERGHNIRRTTRSNVQRRGLSASCKSAEVDRATELPQGRLGRDQLGIVPSAAASVPRPRIPNRVDRSGPNARDREEDSAGAGILDPVAGSADLRRRPARLALRHAQCAHVRRHPRRSTERELTYHLQLSPRDEKPSLYGEGSFYSSIFSSASATGASATASSFG